MINSNAKFRLNKTTQSDAALQFARSLQALQRWASSSLNNLECLKCHFIVRVSRTVNSSVP